MRTLEHELLPVFIFYVVSIFTFSLYIVGFIFALFLIAGAIMSTIGYRRKNPLFKLIGRSLNGICAIVVLICAMVKVKKNPLYEFVLD